MLERSLAVVMAIVQSWPALVEVRAAMNGTREA